MNDELEMIPYGWLASLAESPLLTSSQLSFKKATGCELMLKAASPMRDELPPQYPFLLNMRAPVRVAGRIVAYLAVEAGRLENGLPDEEAFVPFAHAMLEANCSAFELSRAHNAFHHARRISSQEADCLRRTLQRYAFVIGDQASRAVADSSMVMPESPAPAYHNNLSSCCA